VQHPAEVGTGTRRETAPGCVLITATSTSIIVEPVNGRSPVSIS